MFCQGAGESGVGDRGIAGLTCCGRLVQTDMGNTGARLFGMKEAPVATKDSVAGCVAQVCSELILGGLVLDVWRRCTDGLLD